MNINFVFDDERIYENVERGSSPNFMINMEHNGEIYPDEIWYDFGDVIIGWWITAFTNLLQGDATETLLFMDGPYEIDIRFDSDRDYFILNPARTNFHWRVAIKEFYSELRRACNEVLRKYFSLNLPNENIASLDVGFKVLQMSYNRHCNSSQ